MILHSIDDLNYDLIQGDRTRTELALGKAKSVRTHSNFSVDNARSYSTRARG